jgi:uncharacterized protein with PQ loop repeat
MTDLNCGRDPGGVDIGLGIFLVVGTIAAYIPQEITFVKSKTNEGVSLLATLFGNITNFSTILNALVQNWSLLTKCHSVSAWEFFTRLLPLVQLVTVSTHMYLTYFLFLVFFRKGAAIRYKYFSIMGYVFFTLFYIAGGLFTFLFLLNTIGPDADVVVIVNKVVGISAAVLVTMQYVPQIFATCRLKKAGSLNLITLFITASGSFLTAFFLGFSYSQGWLIWLPNVVSGFQQFTVFVLCVIYKCREKREQATTPLLKDPVN